GDVAASLGVGFRRLSYRALAGIVGEVAAEEPAAAPRSRRRGRGRRRGHAERRGPEPAAVAPPAPEAEVAAADAHTAPHDEILAVVRELLATSSSGGVSLDALSNALKARGFRRPPGSPRLITRLHRIKEIEVLPGNLVRLANAEGESAPAAPALPTPGDEPAAAPPQNGGQRRRRRRGGRRRHRHRAPTRSAGRAQTIPRRSLPSGEIICGVHGGSHTSSTSASATPGSPSSFCRASAAIAVPMPQPGAVSVMRTSTRFPPS